MRAFSHVHPLVLFLYFMSVFAVAIMCLQPIMVCIFLVCTTLFYIKACGLDACKKSIRYKLLFLIVIALSNPLFVHQGVTVLGYVQGNPITLEAILYGVNFACMMLGIWNLCACYQVIMDSEKFMYLFGCILPSFALIVTMSIRMITKFKRQLYIIKDTQNILEIQCDTTFLAKARKQIEIFSILITWAFETSIIGADSMKARGYGLHRRKNFHNYHFERRDTVVLVVCSIMSVLLFTAYRIEYQHFYFYPHIVDISYSVLSCMGYIGYTLYLLLPLLLEGWEERRWKSSLSNI